ncbi:MAG TPA: carbonic anhydrase [Anaerolineae bacterium]|nr:carbonic anhydrase [Anaerolineae bacterium]
MDDLVWATRESRATAFSVEADLLAELVQGQHPKILYIGCSDSRIMPSRILGARPGEVFTLRNIANIVPPATAHDQTVAAVLTYAVQHLHVAHIVVCGHSLCGGIQALGAAHARLELALKHWLVYARPATDRVPLTLEGENRLEALIEANVLVQVEHLRSYTFIAQAEAARDLQIHAWVYDFRCGQVRVYDPASGAFVTEPPF